MNEIGFILCATGCTCCSDENHYIGPFTVDDMKRRLAYLNDGHGIIGSQFSRNGRYAARTFTVEQISGNRVIVGDRVYPEKEVEPKTVNADGSPGEKEYFCGEFDL